MSKFKTIKTEIARNPGIHNHRDSTDEVDRSYIGTLIEDGLNLPVYYSVDNDTYLADQSDQILTTRRLLSGDWLELSPLGTSKINNLTKVYNKKFPKVLRKLHLDLLKQEIPDAAEIPVNAPVKKAIESDIVPSDDPAIVDHDKLESAMVAIGFQVKQLDPVGEAFRTYSIFYGNTNVSDLDDPVEEITGPLRDAVEASEFVMEEGMFPITGINTIYMATSTDGLVSMVLVVETGLMNLYRK